MLIVERQERVLAMLREQGAAQLEDLARALDVSGSTVRRDLEALEKRGLIERTHGGAIFKGEPPALGRNVALAERMSEHVEAKRAIGAVAASLVQPHMTLLLDGGSTVVYAARLIEARPLQIVTTSLAIANQFADDDQVELVLAGGNLYPRTGVTIGPIATGTLAELHADLMFFSLAGIFGDEAFNVNLAMAQVEQVMMQQAARAVLLMDASKFGRKSLARVCNLAEIEQIVTDAAIAPPWRDRLEDRLVVAE